MKSSIVVPCNPYEIFFGEGIEKRGLDYFADYEPAFAVVREDAERIASVVVDEFVSFVENDEEMLHLEVGGMDIYSDAAGIMEPAVEEMVYRGLYFGYKFAEGVAGHEGING